MTIGQLKEYIDIIPEDLLASEVKIDAITPIFDKFGGVKQSVCNELNLTAIGMDYSDGVLTLVGKQLNY